MPRINTFFMYLEFPNSISYFAYDTTDSTSANATVMPSAEVHSLNSLSHIEKSSEKYSLTMSFSALSMHHLIEENVV